MIALLQHFILYGTFADDFQNEADGQGETRLKRKRGALDGAGFGASDWRLSGHTAHDDDSPNRGSSSLAEDDSRQTLAGKDVSMMATTIHGLAQHTTQECVEDDDQAHARKRLRSGGASAWATTAGSSDDVSEVGSRPKAVAEKAEQPQQALGDR